MAKGQWPNKDGPPQIISEQIIKDIIQAIRIGGYIETAAAYAGISKDSFYRWLKKGARENREEVKGTEPSLYAKLSDAIEKATADAELADVEIIDRHAKGFTATKTTEKVRMVGGGYQVIERTTETVERRDWQAAAWRLERKNPGRWGRRDRRELTGADGNALFPDGSGPDNRLVVILPDNGREPGGNGKNAQGSDRVKAFGPIGDNGNGNGETRRGHRGVDENDDNSEPGGNGNGKNA